MPVGQAERVVRSATDADGTIRLTREQLDGGTYGVARAQARSSNKSFFITNPDADLPDSLVVGPGGTGLDQTDLPAGMQVAPNGSARDG